MWFFWPYKSHLQRFIVVFVKIFVATTVEGRLNSFTPRDWIKSLCFFMCDGNKSRGIRHTLRGWCRWFLIRKFGESLNLRQPASSSNSSSFKIEPFSFSSSSKTNYISQELHHTQIIATSTSSPFLSIVLRSLIYHKISCFVANLVISLLHLVFCAVNRV